MPQLREEKLIQPATLFLQETLINIKTCHFHSSINHQGHFFHRTCITSSFCPVNIAKFLRTAFFQTSRGSCLKMFFKIGVLKSSQESTHAGGSFQKNLQTQGLQLYITEKKASPQVLSCEVCGIFKNTFFIFFIEYLW